MTPFSAMAASRSAASPWPADEMTPAASIASVGAAKGDLGPDRRSDGRRSVVHRGADQERGGERHCRRSRWPLRGGGAEPMAPMAIPTSLHASLLARLDRLAPTRELAQIGAALGRSPGSPKASTRRSCRTPSCMTPINEFMRRLATPKHEAARHRKLLDPRSIRSMRLQQRPTASARCRGLSQAVGSASVQISKRPFKLAITDIGTTGKQCLQCRQECRSLGCLQRTGGVDDSKRLRFSEGHLVRFAL